MLKILIVEDEIPLLRSLKQKICSINPDYEVIGEASDGEAALKLVDELHPDTVITDIRMPIINGLDLIKILRRDHNEIIPVILSGYNDFEYARQALKLNVEEYLLKPVDLKSLAETLESCAKKHKNDSELREYNMLQAAVLNLEHQNLPGCIGDTKNQYLLIYFCIGNYNDKGIDTDQLNRTEISETFMDDIVSANTDDSIKMWHFSREFPNEKLIAVKMEKQRASLITQTAEGLYKKVRESAAGPVTMIAGGYVSDTGSIPAVIDRLRARIVEKLIIGKSQLLFEDSINGSSYDQVISGEKISRLLFLARQNQVSFIRTELKKIFDFWKASNYPLGIIEKELEFLLNSIQNELRIKTCGSTNELKTIIYKSGNPDELYLNFCNMLDKKYLSEHKNIQRREADELVCIVEEFFRNNICEHISLDVLCERLGVSKVYLCRIFKKYRHMSPINCFISMKINKAKEYIHAYPGFAFKEIADLLGYDNPHYFSKLFKQVEGVSLSEYKKLIDAKSGL